jgi:uncharacterized protein YkwD
MWRSLLAGLLLCGLTVAADDRKEKPDQGKAPELTADEKALVELVNKDRAKQKIGPVKVNPVLCRVARVHSENMAKQEKMAHVLDGKRVPQRVAAAGYDYRIVAENLALVEIEGNANAPPSPPADVHKNWMNSKGHRANILNGRFTEVGISMVKSKKGNWYYTQVFATPRK